MDVVIRQITDFPCNGFDSLRRKSIEDGYDHIDRLAVEWNNGENQFNLPGEILFGVWVGDEMVGIGGRNRDPYQDNPRVGRIRHIYTHSAYRRQGIGRLLVEKSMKGAESFFDCLRLSTSNPDAAALYESLGFSPRKEIKCSHFLNLKSEQ